MTDAMVVVSGVTASVLRVSAKSEVWRKDSGGASALHRRISVRLRSSTESLKPTIDVNVTRGRFVR